MVVDEVSEAFFTKAIYAPETKQARHQSVDSHNGYFWKFEVYTGKQGDKGLPARVVKSLTEELKGKCYHVYYNFFNSFELLNDLVADNIFACGTAPSNYKVFLKL